MIFLLLILTLLTGALITGSIGWIQWALGALFLGFIIEILSQ